MLDEAAEFIQYLYSISMASRKDLSVFAKNHYKINLENFPQDDSSSDSPETSETPALSQYLSQEQTQQETAPEPGEAA